MVQVIGAGTPRGPSTGQQLASGVNSVLGAFIEHKQNKQQREAIAKFAPELAGLPPEMVKAAIPQLLKGRQGPTALQQTQEQLNKARLQQIEEQSQMFNQLRGAQPSQNQTGMEQGQPQQSQQGGIESFPEEALHQMSAFKGQPGKQGVIGNMADAELNRREKVKQQQSRFSEAERHEAFEINKPLFQELNESRKNIPLQEQAIEDIKNASPDVGMQDYIAELMGFEPGRTPEGAKLKTAIKDFFLSDLTRAGARPNQWIEQQLMDALPKVGRDPVSNLITAEGMDFKVKLAKKRVEILDDLAEQDRKKYGFVKADYDSRASKLMKPYTEQAKKELIDNITKIQKDAKPSKGYVRMTDPETGESWDILEGNVKEAKRNGWK